jgi:hypothetical protein
LNYNIEEGSIDEESDHLASHRCSMVKRYHMPTFFTPGKAGMQELHSREEAKKG